MCLLLCIERTHKLLPVDTVWNYSKNWFELLYESKLCTKINMTCCMDGAWCNSFTETSMQRLQNLIWLICVTSWVRVQALSTFIAVVARTYIFLPYSTQVMKLWKFMRIYNFVFFLFFFIHYYKLFRFIYTIVWTDSRIITSRLARQNIIQQ